VLAHSTHTHQRFFSTACCSLCHWRSSSSGASSWMKRLHGWVARCCLAPPATRSSMHVAEGRRHQACQHAAQGYVPCAAVCSAALLCTVLPACQHLQDSLPCMPLEGKKGCLRERSRSPDTPFRQHLRCRVFGGAAPAMPALPQICCTSELTHTTFWSYQPQVQADLVPHADMQHAGVPPVTC
jgi:hypothetical protein